LCGAASYWSNSTQGKLFDLLVKSPTANPVMLIDEIDKSHGDRMMHDPVSALYSLLEEGSAKNWCDLSIPLKMDTTGVVWLMTANNADKLEAPILSRMTRIDVKAPTAEQSLVITKNIYRSVIARFQGFNFEPELDDQLAKMLSEIPPRKIKSSIEDALATAIINDSHKLVESDFVFEKKDAEKRSIGFM
jgi:ATP-dependent Lon protease